MKITPSEMVGRSASSFQTSFSEVEAWRAFDQMEDGPEARDWMLFKELSPLRNFIMSARSLTSVLNRAEAVERKSDQASSRMIGSGEVNNLNAESTWAIAESSAASGIENSPKSLLP